ncbi:MAG: hypothetical protein M3Z26_06460 [Bacteroidota bacterium]|nr:hypothetical protein [Bacteroidota bacterium]
MLFNKFISIILSVFGGYYLIVILFDVLKSKNHVATVNTHRVQFESDNPMMINDEEVNLSLSTKVDINDYKPKEDTKKNSLLIDLGLETLSGESYEMSAENLSKFIIA